MQLLRFFRLSQNEFRLLPDSLPKMFEELEDKSVLCFTIFIIKNMKKIILILVVLCFFGIDPAISRDNRFVNWSVSKKQIKHQRKTTNYRRHCNRIFQQHLQTYQKPGLGGYFSISYENFRLRPQKQTKFLFIF